jgi:SynChlorMet cassette protein ScmD
LAHVWDYATGSQVEGNTACSRREERPVCDKRYPTANSLLVLREEFDDWAILFDPDSGKAVGLDPVGVFVWKLLDGKHTQGDILEQITGEFYDVPTDAGLHLAEFIDHLRNRGWVGYEIEHLNHP